MNINSTIFERNKFCSDNDDVLKNMGFIDYRREITLFLKENKNTNGIMGHNLVTKINCLVTNYSIFHDHKLNNRLFTKTTYVCEVEFPNNITINMLKRNIDSFVSVATINPIHAFTNAYLVESNGNIRDYGLSLLDLTLPTASFHILNFSNLDQSDKLNRFIIYDNKYNLRFYNSYDCNALYDFNSHSEKSCPLVELYDYHSHITCNTHGNETVDNFINNNPQTGIYINKRTVKVSESLSDIFNKILFVSIDGLEFVYDSRNDDINIKKLSFFTRFNKSLEDRLCLDIHNSIIEWKETFKANFKNIDYYLVLSIDKQFAILDILFFDTHKEIRITKPLYKLYGEFSLNSETLMNDVKSMSDIAKLDYIEQSIEAASRNGNKLALGESIHGVIDMIDSATKTLQLMICDKKDQYSNLIGTNDVKLLESNKDTQ